ncbi:IF2 family translation initiation factor [Mycolicibacterium sp. CBMA 226]|uniref:IF2 family translation initiation factor n=1 Tax=Mycolicibacterium sp. CBMA 226 TaxID=2606611 RepID=UPI0012DDAF22|nr:IF2 family translation initiation factor [Mycolicibacterium sp. CBMA 226]MUL74574.1 IF2 family translation initiation factor [Mycolicibacterium sp. CBMA 226]
MSIIELPLQVLRAQYRLARFPLQFIEERWIARLDAEAPARLIFERSFGALDAAVGGALGDSALRKRGAVLARRSEVRGQAAVRSMAAAKRRKQAGTQLEESLEDVANDRDEAIAAKQDAVVDARERAQQRKRQATEEADKRIAEAAKDSRTETDRKREAVDSAERQRLQRINRAEEKAAAAAKAALDDARDKRAAAAAKREQAEQVEALAEVEKQNRRAGRV